MRLSHVVWTQMPLAESPKPEQRRTMLESREMPMIDHATDLRRIPSTGRVIAADHPFSATSPSQKGATP